MVHAYAAALPRSCSRSSPVGLQYCCLSGGSIPRARNAPTLCAGGAWRASRARRTAAAILWVLPLAYAVWAAFHPGEFTTRFALFAPLTLENFERAWAAAPFARYFFNTFVLVTMILACQLVLCTLAAYAFARYEFAGRNVAFALVLAQLMIMPDVLIVENYRTMGRIGLIDTIPAIALPTGPAFGISVAPTSRPCPGGG